MRYNKYENVHNVPLILEPEDWTEEEYKVIKKVFNCPKNTTRIKVNYNSVENFEEKNISKTKYMMIVTAEDERYEKGEVQLDFFMEEPWEGVLEDIVFGNNAQELFGNGEYEGLFYQVYETETGTRIGWGTIDCYYPKEEIEEWEKEKDAQQIRGKIEQDPEEPDSEDV